MNPFDLFQGPFVLVIYALLILALLRIVAPDGIALDDIMQLPVEREWPRGVQEEEPVRWRVELLSPRVEAAGSGRTDRGEGREPTPGRRTADVAARPWPGKDAIDLGLGR